MNWFKFYGQDWMTDMKIMRLSMEDRLCYLTLLCLASSSQDRGVLESVDEDTLINMSRIPFDPYNDYNPYERAKGCLDRFEQLGMIEVIHNTVTDGVTQSVTVVIKNFKKRQDTFLSNSERQKKFRENKKKKELSKANSNGKVTGDVTKVTLDKIREDKNRIDKNIERVIAHERKPSPSQEAKEFFDSEQKQQEFVQNLILRGVDEPIARQELRKFVSYWTERNKSGTKQKWQLQPTFELVRRLSKWFENSQKWAQGGAKTNQNEIYKYDPSIDGA